MSDYEYSSGEDYEYEDDDSNLDEDDEQVEIANTYSLADDEKDRSPKDAIPLFEKVVELEQAAGDEVEWRFKALKHLVLLHIQLGNSEAMLTRYRELLTYITKVTSNETLDAVNSVLDSVGAASGLEMGALSEMYQVTLASLKSHNGRLWFNTNVKLAKLYLANKEYAKIRPLIAELHESCKDSSGALDTRKGTDLMEVYALQIQLCTQTGNTTEITDIYAKVKSLNAAINDPRIMGVIHENFGTMMMSQEQWQEAYLEFFDAFRSYSEAGNSRARTCLKYVVLANMLALEQINPFDSQEAKVFKDDPEVNAMWRLRNSYTDKNFEEFYRLLTNPRYKIGSDAFILKYLQPLIDSFRSVVVLNTIKPYRNVSLDFLATVVKADRAEVEALLVTHILDGEIMGTIDQVRGYLHITRSGTGASARIYPTLSHLTSSLQRLQSNLQQRLGGSRM